LPSVFSAKLDKHVLLPSVKLKTLGKQNTLSKKKHSRQTITLGKDFKKALGEYHSRQNTLYTPGKQFILAKPERQWNLTVL
jgi:hypothetical protein